MKTKIYILDSCDIVIQGISSYLKNEDRFEVIGKAETGEKALLDLRILQANILILDINLAGIQGFEIAKQVKKKHPLIKIVFLTFNKNEESLNKSMNVGGKAYLLKSIQKEEFLFALKTVCEGETYFSTGVHNLVNHTKKIEEAYLIPLTKREIEVVKLFVEGYSYKKIASQLVISSRTVETHKKNILSKLKLKTTVDLVKYAIKEGIIAL